MNTYKKFWQDHPILLRITAFFVLILMPIVFVIVYLVNKWPDIFEEFILGYKDTWKILTEKKNG